MLEKLGDAAAELALVVKVVSNSRLDTCPRLFLLVPAAADTRPVKGKPSLLRGLLDRGKALVSVKWRLYLLCEGATPGEPHFVEGTSPIEMDVPKEALLKAAPYLKLCASLLSAAVKVTTGLALPPFLSDLPGSDAVGRLMEAVSGVAAASGDAASRASDALQAAADAVDGGGDAAHRVDALAAQLAVRACVPCVHGCAHQRGGGVTKKCVPARVPCACAADVGWRARLTRGAPGRARRRPRRGDTGVQARARGSDRPGSRVAVSRVRRRDGGAAARGRRWGRRTLTHSAWFDCSSSSHIQFMQVGSPSPQCQILCLHDALGAQAPPPVYRLHSICCRKARAK